MRTYTDDQLVAAVAGARSWRGVMRALGLRATSSGAVRSVRRHAERLDLDSAHFTGQRTWTEIQLADAVARSHTWAQVVDCLGLSPGSGTTTVRGHARRLGLDVTHLSRPAAGLRPPGLPDRGNIRRAGSLLAASWFELVGDQVSWPLEPCRYDLLVWRRSGPERIQVKTTTQRTATSWEVQITDSRRAPYDPDDIDQFFIVDGALDFYLIPVSTVGGFQTIVVSAYEAFRLPPFTTVFGGDPG